MADDHSLFGCTCIDFVNALHQNGGQRAGSTDLPTKEPERCREA
jgi:hypothetical protein